MRTVTFLAFLFISAALASPVENVDSLMDVQDNADSADTFQDLNVQDAVDFADDADIETSAEMMRKVIGEFAKHAPDFVGAVKDGIDKGNMQQKINQHNQNQYEKAKEKTVQQPSTSSSNNWAKDAWNKYGGHK